MWRISTPPLAAPSPNWNTAAITAALQSIQGGLINSDSWRTGTGDYGIRLYGSIELQAYKGPVFQDKDYEIYGSILAIGETPKTEYFWFDSFLVDPDTGDDIISMIMMMLFIGHVVQVAIWAVLFMALGEFSDFSIAFYHSMVNFASLGYGDIVMHEEWRLLGAIEASNGVLMFGLSAGAMLSIMSYILAHDRRFEGHMD